MQITIVGIGMKVGEQLKEKVEKKLRRYDRLAGEDASVQVKLSPEGEDKKVEITIKRRGSYLRAEAVSEDLMDALDETVRVMDRQIRKQKTRLSKKHSRDYSHLTAYLEELAKEELPVPERDELTKEGKLIRRKSFEIEEMTAEEACLQMELLGHGFLLFLSPEDHQVCLVYRRRDGDYGLIEPEYT